MDTLVVDSVRNLAQTSLNAIQQRHVDTSALMQANANNHSEAGLSVSTIALAFSCAIVVVQAIALYLSVKKQNKTQSAIAEKAAESQRVIAEKAAESQLAVAKLQFEYQHRIKIDEMRQAWINALRDHLAECTSLVSTAAWRVSMELARVDDVEKYLVPAMLSLWKIRLHLNPDEPNNRNLIRLLEELVSYSKGEDAGVNREKMGEINQRIVELSCTILKKEWDRISKRDIPQSAQD